MALGLEKQTDHQHRPGVGTGASRSRGGDRDLRDGGWVRPLKRL